nr:hypothetical protein [Paenarthrobacter aurescens]
MGLLLVLLVAGWFVWLFRPARKTLPLRKPAPPDVETLRAGCLAAIDATASDVDAGRLPERDAHQRLSFLVREFAGAATGLPVTSMTLDELRLNGFDSLAEGIAGMYPNEFAPSPAQPVQRSADIARQVVQAWN